MSRVGLSTRITPQLSTAVRATIHSWRTRGPQPTYTPSNDPFRNSQSGGTPFANRQPPTRYRRPAHPRPRPLGRHRTTRGPRQQTFGQTNTHRSRLDPVLPLE